MPRTAALQLLGATGADLGLSDEDRAAVLAVQVPRGDAATWAALAATSPLSPPVDAQLSPEAIDDAMEQHLPHLMEVCRRPHARLDVVIEPTLAARTRRLAPSAVEYLAEHSEDWYRRSAAGVLPRRLLAQRVEPAINVYENRVAASLIDQLQRHLRKRLTEVRKLRDMLEDALHSSQDLTGTQHRLAWRLSELWGDNAIVDDQIDRIEALEELLQERLRQTSGLKDSVLYHAIPRRARAAGALQTTNVLTDHQHYRRVAALWLALERYKQHRRRAPEDREAARRRLLDAYDEYCLLLVARALEGLGLAAPPDATIRTGEPWEVDLTGLPSAVALRWDPDASATILVDGRPVVRLVPLPVSLSAPAEDAPDPTLVRERLDRLAQQKWWEDGVPVVVLYPGVRLERRGLTPEMARELNAPEAGLPSRRPALVPATPLDLFSLERVERVVRRAVTVAAFERFPPEAACRRSIREQLLGAAGWLAATGSLDTVAVLQPPDEQLLHQLGRAFHDSLAGLHPGRERDALVRELDAFLEAVRATRPLFDHLRRCPVCNAGNARFTLLGENRFFSASCGVCGATWGLYACANGHRIPVLDTGGRGSHEPSPDGLDRAYGRDILAVPCAAPGATNAFVCPTCHSCPGSTSSCGPDCLRAA